MSLIPDSSTMPSATLTAEQTRALTTRDTSVALAAGAGCGKTFVLTERYLSELEPSRGDAPDPATLSQLIAITFTDAAAREMRSRIRGKCYERLQSATTAADQDYWLRLLRAIEAARVSTIHAFCAALLQTNAVAAGVDPAFGVLEQGEADVLVSEAIDDVLRERLAAAEDDLLELAAAYGLSQVKQQLRELVSYRHAAHFALWRDASPETILQKWQTCHATDAFSAAIAELAELPEIGQILRLLEVAQPRAENELFLAARAALLDLLPRLQSARVTADDLGELVKFARVKDRTSICTAKDWPDADTYDQYKTACEVLRHQIERQTRRPFDPVAVRAAAELGLRLLRLAAAVADAYEAEKSRRGKLDFDDLLARAYRLLTDPEHAAVRQRLADDLKLLLVDEFQDTDQLQVDLVRALCGDQIDDGRLFFVGDFKQSIYRFRGAQPEVFQDLRAGVAVAGRLPLTVNFRSQPAVLHFVNAVFCRAFGDQYEPLQPHRPQATQEPAVEFLWAITPEKANHRLKGAARAAREQEARYVARRLRGLIDEEAKIITDPSAVGGTRPLRLGDVAILFRALGDVDLYEAALREYELDYYLVGGHAFYAQQEIYDVLNLLRAVASPADEVSLAGVLRSPFFALADETLFWLVESRGSLNEGLFAEALPAELSGDERAKTARAAATLADLRRQKDSAPIATLLGEALARTGYDAALLTEFLGERKLANLHKLVEQARAADQGGQLDLAGFIAELAEFVAREPKEPLAATLSESADVVRLMTIHHAKGLEFPLVVVAYLDRRPEFRGPPAALHPQLGPLVPLPGEADNDHAVTGMDLYRVLERRAEADERRRLLYVAVTRAADYLVLSSSLAGYDALQSDWMQLLASQFDLQTGALRGPLPEAYATPRVLVTAEEPVVGVPDDPARWPIGRARGPNLVRILEEARECTARGEGRVPREVCSIAADAGARRQFSVSRLSGQIVRPGTPYDARTTTRGGVDPRELGVLVHAVLERLRLPDDEEIDAWCERLADELVLQHRDQAAELAREMVHRLVQSPRWSAIASAAAVHREVEFLLAWPPDGSSAAPHVGGQYLQGFIDCLYQDAAGGWHLVDYKTNDATAADVPRLAEQYEMQASAYALAAERALGVPPVELVLALLRPGIEHEYVWDEAARRRGIELVSRAMVQIHTESQ